MNRKAIGFGIFIAFLALYVLADAFLLVSSKQAPFKAMTIGQREFALINAYQEAEKLQFYLDVAVQDSAAKAAVALAAKGGGPSCADYLGYALWDQCAMNPDARFAKEMKDSLNAVRRFTISDVVVAQRNVSGVNMIDILVIGDPMSVPIP